MERPRTRTSVEVAHSPQPVAQLLGAEVSPLRLLGRVPADAGQEGRQAHLQTQLLAVALGTLRLKRHQGQGASQRRCRLAVGEASGLPLGRS
jgi:hypothetical protein